MLTFILIFTNVYTASIMNRRSHKINNFGRNFNISFENVTRMLLGNTKKNTCFFSHSFLTIYPQRSLQQHSYLYGICACENCKCDKSVVVDSKNECEACQ